MGKSSNSFAIYTATGRILAMLCNFIVPIFLTRILSQTDYGLYSQFILLLGFTGSIFSFGLQSNLYYFYPPADDARKKTLLGNTLILMLALSILAFVFMEVPVLSSLFIKDELLLQYIGIVGICVLLNVPTYILFPLFVIRKDKKTSVFYPSIEVFIKVVFTVVLALIYNSIHAIFIGLLVVQVLLCIFTLLYTFTPLRKTSASWYDWKLMKEQLKYAIPFGLSVVLFTLFRQFDKVICISYISPADYAIYSLAFYGIPGINQIYDSVSEVNLLNMANSYREGDKKETLALYQSFCSKLLSFSAPLILIVFLFANEIFGLLFTLEYLGAVPFFRIYIFSFLVGALGAGTVIRASGKTKLTLRAYLYSLIIYLPFSYLSIKHYGVWGAITTAMLGIILPKVFQIAFEKNILSVKLKYYMPWRSFAVILLISLLVIMPVAISHHFCHFNVWLACGLSVVYLVVVYYIELKKGLFLIDYESFKNVQNIITKRYRHGKG